MKADTSAASWLKFFNAAGINIKDAENYAVKFSKNQIQLDMLPEINKEYLFDMGITLLGHVIAILRHAKTVYADEVKKTELPDKRESTTAQDKNSLKPSKQITSKKPEPSDDNRPTATKRKSTVVPLNKTPETEDPQPKVRKTLCDSSDDIAVKPVTVRAKPTSSILGISWSAADEVKKGVFERLGNEPTQEPTSSPSNYSSCDVFSRLGGKSPGQQVSKTEPSRSKVIINSNESKSVLLPARKSIIRTRLDKPRLLAPSPYMDSVLDVRISSSTNFGRPQEKFNIKNRLGFPAKSVTTYNFGNSKKVSFGNVEEVIIPRVKKSKPLFNVDQSYISARKSIGAYALGISKAISLGNSSDVFSRLGVK